jgi:hypothetical protein
MEKARKDALELKVALNSATNADTGIINARKFAQELAKNGKTI